MGILAFCSRTCASNGRKGTKSRSLSKKILRRCLVCSGEFLRYRNKDRPQLFCSRSCFLSSDYYSNLQREKMLARDMRGERNPYWKGDAIKYKSLHRWVELQWGLARDQDCSNCHGASGSRKMNWANLDQQYSRDRKSWRVMCKKCHSQYDEKHFKIYSLGSSNRFTLKQLEM